MSAQDESKILRAWIGRVGVDQVQLMNFRVLAQPVFGLGRYAGDESCAVQRDLWAGKGINGYASQGLPCPVVGGYPQLGELRLDELVVARRTLDEAADRGVAAESRTHLVGSHPEAKRSHTDMRYEEPLRTLAVRLHVPDTHRCAPGAS